MQLIFCSYTQKKKRAKWWRRSYGNSLALKVLWWSAGSDTGPWKRPVWRVIEFESENWGLASIVERLKKRHGFAFTLSNRYWIVTIVCPCNSTFEFFFFLFLFVFFLLNLVYLFLNSLTLLCNIFYICHYLLLFCVCYTWYVFKAIHIINWCI